MRVDALLVRRGELAAEVEAIDAELDRVFARLVVDLPVGLRPVPVSDSGAGETSTAVRATDATKSDTRLVVPPVGTCSNDVLALVLKGLHTTSEMAAVLSQWSRERIGDALSDLVRLGWLSRTGASQATRYRLAPEVLERMRQACR